MASSPNGRQCNLEVSSGNGSNVLSGSSNAAYHGNKTHLSSSTLKLLLKSSELFYDEWFLGKKDTTERAAFTEGTFTHSLILEPEKVATDYAVFEGLRKAGQAFEAFKAANPNKLILSAAQVNRCEALYASYAKTELALKLVQGGFPEHTLLSEILNVPVKMRADYLVPGQYIVDVKTTSAVSDLEVFKQTMSDYKYALSAALYAQIAYNNFGTLHDFYFIVLSKADNGCKVYKASSATLSEGMSQVMQALVKYKRCLASGDWSEQTPKLSWQEDIEEV